MLYPWAIPFNVPGLSDLRLSDDSSENGFRYRLTVLRHSNLDSLSSRRSSRHQSGTDESHFDSALSGDLLDMAPIGYMEIDREGIIRRVNRLECKLRGRGRERHAGRALCRSDSQDRARKIPRANSSAGSKVIPRWSPISASTRTRAGSRSRWKCTSNCSKQSRTGAGHAAGIH